MNLEVAGQLGFLVLGSDGAVLGSGGDLQSDERAAATLYQIVQTAAGGELEAGKITISYADHAYIVCSANKKIHIVKKTIASAEVLA